MSHRDTPIDPIRADRLDRDLDQIVMGRPLAGPRAGDDLGPIVARFVDRDARDAEPDPDAAFVHSLRAALLGSSPSVGADTATVSSAPVGLPMQRPPTNARWRGRRALLPAAAAFVLLVAAMMAFVAQRGERDRIDDLPMLAASQPEATTPPVESSIPLLGDAVDVAGCTAATRSATTVANLAGTQPLSVDALPRQPEPGQGLVTRMTNDQVTTLFAGLPAATSEQIAGVESALRQLSACRFTQLNPFGLSAATVPDDPYDHYAGQYFGLFSDDYFRRMLVHVPEHPFDPAILTMNWFPVGPFRTNLVDLRQLHDGRLIAWTEPKPPMGWRWATEIVLVFAQHGGQWIVDELIPIAPDDGAVVESRNATPPPEHGQFAHILDVRLDDGGGHLWNTPTNNLTFSAGTEVYVTLANLGTRPHRFEIPALGVRIVVPAGHSVSFILTAPASTYDFRSATEGENGEDAEQVRGVLTFIPEGESIPMG